jgi:hypothetical protein
MTPSYSGGLGFEGRSGVVFSVWDSGTVVRAPRFQAPDGAHVIGNVAASDLEGVVDRFGGGCGLTRPTRTLPW